LVQQASRIRTLEGPKVGVQPLGWRRRAKAELQWLMSVVKTFGNA
jgi:hypothetical protein